MCVKYAGSLGAGVMFEAGAFTSQERFTSLVFCLVCRDVSSQCGTSESLVWYVGVAGFLSAILVRRVGV